MNRQMNLVDALVMARNHANSIIAKSEREDDGSLYELGNALKHGSAAKVEQACRSLATSYDDVVAKNILLGYEL